MRAPGNIGRALGSFAATGLVLLVSLLTSVILARSLGPEGRGLLLALIFWPALLSALFNLSLNEAVAYHMAQRPGTDDAQMLAGTAFWLELGVTGLALAATLLALQLVVPATYRDQLVIVSLYTAAFVPLAVFDLFFRAILQGRGQIGTLSLARLAQPIAYLLLLLLACLLVQPLSVPVVLAVLIGALALSAATGAVLSRFRLTRFRPAVIRPVLRSGWTFHRANLLLYGAAEVDKLVLLLMMTTHDAGLYAVGIAVSAIGTGIVLQSLGLVLVRDMAANPDPAGRRRVYATSMRSAFAVLIGVNVIAALLAAWWVPLLFGGAFAAAVPMTILLLVAGACKGARQMVDKALRATHHTRIGMIGEVTALAGIVIFGVPGALMAGPDGLAAGVLVAHALAMLLVLMLSQKEFGVSLLELWPFQRATFLEVRALMAATRDRVAP